MFRRVLAGLVVMLFVSSVLGLSAASTADGPVPVTTPEGFDSTTFQIHVFDNGSAEWSILHSRPLRNETEVSDFREFAQTFNSQDTETVRNFRTRSQWTVQNVSDALGREMNASNFAHEARVDTLGQTTGEMELTFTWGNFAREVNRTVIVDDVFSDGLVILEDQRLVVRRGAGLVFVEVSPEPATMTTEENLSASTSVTWIGEQRFADRRPSIRLASPDVAKDFSDGGATDGAGRTTGSPGSGTDGAGSDGGTGTEPSDGGSNSMLLVGAVLVLLLGVIGAAWYTGLIESTRDEGPDGVTASESSARAGAASTGAAEPSVPAEELLSDEDRVVQLLQDNGGRMKQVNIVDETDWSKSKVSMLLSEMEDEDRISKLRVGRENIISLSGQEPEAAGSPFEDE